MTHKKQIKSLDGTPPYVLIVEALNENTKAIEQLIQFYQPYIRTLATKWLYDASGNTHHVVDEQICRQLEIKLISAILKFTI